MVETLVHRTAQPPQNVENTNTTKGMANVNGTQTQRRLGAGGRREEMPLRRGGGVARSVTQRH